MWRNGGVVVPKALRSFLGHATLAHLGFRMQIPTVREATFPRKTQILEGLELARMVGAEIGPLDKPLVTKAEGQVLYVDHCDTDALKQRWSADSAVDASVLHVDAVWGQASLREALDRARAFDLAPAGLDYIVASHVIEHVPDLISWLRELRDSLAPAGSVRLAVPDKRYTFDYLRNTSTLADVFDAYIRKRRTPSGNRVFDFISNLADIDCAAAWRGELGRETISRKHTVETALNLAIDAESTATYHDVHCWVFTPSSFAELMLCLGESHHLEFKCGWLTPTAPDTFEFLVSLIPESDHQVVAQSWRDVRAQLSQ